MFPSLTANGPIASHFAAKPPSTGTPVWSTPAAHASPVMGPEETIDHVTGTLASGKSPVPFPRQP
jgi:hypothetical protein